MNTHKKKAGLPTRTLRDCKALLTHLMDNHQSIAPITVTVSYEGGTESFELIPRVVKKQKIYVNPEIQIVASSDLENISEPGVYLAIDNLQINEKLIVTNYYGMCINTDKQREIRYFEEKKPCTEWLQKKLRTLHA